MISVRIPNEIRAYKEKLVLGLNGRQLICTILALAICVPLYIWGNRFLPEELCSWMIMLIGFPLVAIGFFKLNGLPFEKFIIAVVKYFFAPSKRRYKTSNVFRENNEAALKYERPATNKDVKKLEKYNRLAAMEKIVLMQEAEERGDMEMNIDEQELLTVSKPNIKYPVDRFAETVAMVSKDSTLKMSKSKRKLMIAGESISKKIENNPEYVMTKPEEKAMIKYRLLVENLRKQQITQKKKEASKTNALMKKRRTAKYTIPRITADSIPLIATYDEGMFEVAPNKYSKQYLIQDINYRVAKQEAQEAIFSKLCELYNSFNEDVHFSVTIDNRIVSMEEQERRVLYSHTGDSYDRHRDEYNRVLRQQLSAGRNDIILQKYLTVTIDANEPMEALLRFRRMDNDIITKFRNIGAEDGTGTGANATVMSTTDRLSYLHDKFRFGHEGEFLIDYDFLQKQGLSCLDYIAPPSFDFGHAKYFQMGDIYYRVVYISRLANSLSDNFMYDLYSCEFPLTITMNIQPVDQARGMKIVRHQLTGIEANKIQAEQKAVKSNYSPDMIRRDIKDAYAQALQLYEDMDRNDQKMFMVTFTILVQGKTLDEVNQNVSTLESKASACTCQIMSLPYQQEEAFKMTLPLGYVSKDMAIDRTLTTESTAIFMPFSNLELFQSGGFPYGQNAISKNMLVVNRLKMKTASGFIIGSTGAGKSFATKREILNVLLHDNSTNVIIIDPENEYSDFVRAFGGTVIKISADAESHINPMDMDMDYGLDEDDDSKSTPLAAKKEKAIKKKSDFIMSIIERMISTGSNADETTISPVQKTIVDRCVKRCYQNYLDHDFDEQYLPTLLNLQEEFNAEKELELTSGYNNGEAREIADSVEYYTKGSLNVFSNKTNIDLGNRFIAFSIRDIGEQLKQVAQVILFDFIWNRMVRNKQKNIHTFCYCDEIHIMFASYYAANFLKQLYKRGRKYGMVITGITQNVTDLIQSEQARGMLANSDFIMMLNQKMEDMNILADVLKISDSQKKFAMNVDAGSGLLFAEKVIVPFEDKFPNDSYLYKLMSTKFGETLSRAEADALIRQIMGETA